MSNAHQGGAQTDGLQLGHVGGGCRKNAAGLIPLMMNSKLMQDLAAWMGSERDLTAVKYSIPRRVKLVSDSQS